MIPLIAIIVFVGAIWRLRGKIPSNIFLTGEEETPTPQEETGTKNPWYNGLNKFASKLNAKKLWRTDWFPSIVGAVGIWIDIWMLLPEWWARRWLENFWLLILIIGLIMLGFSMMPPPKVPAKNRIGKTLVGLATATFVLLIFLKSDYAQKMLEEQRVALKTWWYSKPTATTKPPLQTPQASNNTFLPLNPEGERTVRDFWENRSGLSPQEAGIMVQHARLESNFNQLGRDGKPYRVVPKNPQDDATAMGIMQIKESLWGAKAKELDLDLSSTKGNLEFALWLVKQRVDEGKPFDIDWAETAQARTVLQSPGSTGRELTVFASGLPREEVVLAPAGKWSDWIEGLGSRTVIKTDGPIWYSDSLERNLPVGAGSEFGLNSTDRIKIRSRNDQPGFKSLELVHVTIKRW